MVQIKAPVLCNRRIAPDHFLMRLRAPSIASRALPGQFIHVLCDEPTLLRRPFSLMDLDAKSGTVDFIYKRVGLGTNVLSRVPEGKKADLLGPLGTPFKIPAGLKTAYLVGGGVGIPPLYLLAKALIKSGLSGARVKVFLGARTSGWVICAEMFRRLGVEVLIATDDGTLGYRGSVVDLLKTAITSSLGQAEGRLSRTRGSKADSRWSLPSSVIEGGNDRGMLYICGPTPMMAAAAAFVRREKLPAQVSLEERMGCAMGVCMGCVVEVTTEPVGSHARFQRVCTEGPVFPAEAIAWR